MTGREFYQNLGTDAMRDVVHPDIHIKKLFREFRPDADCWIIHDLRFQNEADAIKARDGHLVRIVRPKSPHHAFEAEPLPHKSEVGLHWKHFQYSVCNDGDVDDLEKKAAMVAG